MAGNSRFKSFKDLREGNSSDDEDEKNLFTGGERSGLEVEKPPQDNVSEWVRDLLLRAEKVGAKEKEGKTAPTPLKFKRAGHKLGTEDEPSEIIEGEQVSETATEVVRTFTFWKEGFSIGTAKLNGQTDEEGELYRYDDPANEQYMRDIDQGAAPRSLFKVLPGQEVKLLVKNNRNQSYNPRMIKKRVTFSGKGQRLGSPVPGEINTTSESDIFEETTSNDKGKEKIINEIPAEKEYETTIQIRMADGRKLKVIVNKNGPVQQLFDFVDTVISDPREYYLSLSYPIKPITTKEISIDDAKLAHSVVIQRWKM